MVYCQSTVKSVDRESNEPRRPECRSEQPKFSYNRQNFHFMIPPLPSLVAVQSKAGGEPGVIIHIF